MSEDTRLIDDLEPSYTKQQVAWWLLVGANLAVVAFLLFILHARLSSNQALINLSVPDTSQNVFLSFASQYGWFTVVSGMANFLLNRKAGNRVSAQLALLIFVLTWLILWTWNRFGFALLS